MRSANPHFVLPPRELMRLFILCCHYANSRSRFVAGALISQACLVKNKDIRKFLDGTYVSEKGNISVPEE